MREKSESLPDPVNWKTPGPSFQARPTSAKEECVPGPVPWDASVATELIRERRHLPGATLPILHALQDRFGYVDADAIPLIAGALNLSRAEVVGVLHFYHDFRQQPPGRHVLRVCLAEACQSMGSAGLVDQLRQRLGIDVGETTPDGAVTLEPVYCLGNCALSPAVMLDGRLVGRVDAARAERLFTEATA